MILLKVPFLLLKLIKWVAFLSLLTLGAHGFYVYLEPTSAALRSMGGFIGFLSNELPGGELGRLFLSVDIPNPILQIVVFKMSVWGVQSFLAPAASIVTGFFVLAIPV